MLWPRLVSRRRLPVPARLRRRRLRACDGAARVPIQLFGARRVSRRRVPVPPAMDRALVRPLPLEAECTSPGLRVCVLGPRHLPRERSHRAARACASPVSRGRRATWRSAGARPTARAVGSAVRALFAARLLIRRSRAGAAAARDARRARRARGLPPRSIRYSTHDRTARGGRGQRGAGVATHASRRVRLPRRLGGAGVRRRRLPRRLVPKRLLRARLLPCGGLRLRGGLRRRRLRDRV